MLRSPTQKQEVATRQKLQVPLLPTAPLHLGLQAYILFRSISIGLLCKTQGTKVLMWLDQLLLEDQQTGPKPLGQAKLPLLCHISCTFSERGTSDP